MAQDLRTLNTDTGESREKRRGFRPFRSMAEGLQNRRARLDALSILDSALACPGPEALSEAVGAFIALPSAQRHKLLLAAQKRVVGASATAFDSRDGALEITLLASFFREAADMMPVDSEGNKLCAPYAKAIGAFAKAADARRTTNGMRESQDAAALACTEALWSLDYSPEKFWARRLFDGATKGFAIKSLLEMPETAEFEDHGWALLRKHIDELAVDIARSSSPKRSDFIRMMLKDEDPAVVEAAVKSVMYLMPVPDAILAGLKDVGGLEVIITRVGRKLARKALDAGHDASIAMEAADGLVTIALNGVTPYSAAEFRKITESLQGSVEGRKYLFGLTGPIVANAPELCARGKQDLAEAAGEIESGAVNLCIAGLNFSDDRQFSSAMELAGLYASGRRYILESGILPYAMGEMVDIVFNPGGRSEAEQSAQREKALGVLRAMNSLGLGVVLSPPKTGDSPGQKDAAIRDGMIKLLTDAGVKVAMAKGQPPSG